MDSHTHAINIVKTLKKAGFKAYFAGGWVRDHVMGHDSEDIDIATDALPQQIIDLFPRTILVGIAFGVVVVISGGHQFEIATFRKDVEYLDGRKPEKVEYCEAEEDARRRDFTINGLFYDPIEDAVYDYVGGLEDIKGSVVRTIGDPYERFREDRLRMIRAFRFAARFGFVIDTATEEAIKANAPTLFPPVAMERVWSELQKMASKPRFDRALIEMQRLKLLPVIFPALEELDLNRLEQLTAPFAQFPVGTPAILYIAALFPDTGNLRDLCLYLKASKETLGWTKSYLHARMLVAKEQEFYEETAWVTLFADPNSILCLGVIAAGMEADDRDAFIARLGEREERLSRHIARARDNKTVITGSRLANEGVPPGKLMGSLIEEGERLAIEYNLEDAEAVMKLLKQSPEWGKLS